MAKIIIDGAVYDTKQTNLWSKGNIQSNYKGLQQTPKIIKPQNSEKDTPKET